MVLSEFSAYFHTQMKKLFSKISLPLKILISIGILALLYQKMDLDHLKQALEKISLQAWGGAILLLLAQLFLQSLRWKYLINVGQTRMTYPVALQVTLASHIANSLFIATISGVVVRIAVALQLGCSLFKALFATAIDRVLTLASLVLLSAIFLPSLSHYIDVGAFKNISILIGISIIMIFVITPFFALKIITLTPEKIISKANIVSGVRYLKILFSNNSLLLKILVISLMAQISFFIAIYIIMSAAGLALSFIQIMTVLPAIAIVSSLPVSIGGWGIREGAFIYGLGLLNISMETAFSASVQIGILGLLATVVAGAPALLWESEINLLKRYKKN